jgi:hypothetical protein
MLFALQVELFFPNMVRSSSPCLSFYDEDDDEQ